MGRETKQGLDYFPVDVDIFEDDKILIAQETADPDGEDVFLRFCVPYVAIYLLKEIYTRGYYTDWNDTVCRLYASKIKSGVTFVILKKIVASLVYSEFFNADKLNKYKILTSRGIQKRWLLIMNLRRRKSDGIKKEYLLTEKSYSQPKIKDKYKKREYSEEIRITSEENSISCTESDISSRNPHEDSTAPFYISNTISNSNSKEYISNITEEEYIENIKKYTNKNNKSSEEMPITSEENNKSSEEMPITSEENNKSSEEMPITSEENNKSSEEIKLTSADWNLMNNLSEDFRQVWQDWENYNWQQNGKKYKSIISRRSAIEGLSRISGYNENEAIEIIKNTISRCWSGFYDPKSSVNQPFMNGSGIKKQNKKTNGTKRGPEPGKDASPEDWERWFYGDKN